MKNHPLLRLLKVFAAAFLLTVPTGAVMAAADISVAPATGAFGNVLVNTTTSTITFTISNPGDASFTLSPAASIIGTTEFSIITPAAGTVGAGGNTTLTVRCTPTSAGPKIATLRIPNSVAGKNPQDIALSATGTAPEIIVEELPSNANVADNNPVAVSFATVDLGGSTAAFSDKSFTIRNTGTGNLTGLAISNLVGTDYSVTAPPAATVAPGGSTTFTVRFQPTTKGTKTAQIQITNNDLDESPFRINVTAVAASPVISMELPAGTPFASGATATFPGTSIGFSSELTFTLTNSGDSALNMTSFTFGGVSTRAFDLNGAAPTTLGAGVTTTFTVRFGPDQAGNFGANLTIANNSATDPFTIILMGSGQPNTTLTDAFGYSYTKVNGGNVLDFLVEGEAGVVKEATLTGIDKALPIDLGFDFYFYEKAYSRCSISTTGLITFGGPSTNYIPSPIPSATAPDNFIAPLWTDIQLLSDSRILYKTAGTFPNRIFIVKYQNVKLYHNGAATTNKRVTFQVQLYEGSNAIQIRYKDETPAVASPPQQLTVGIESRNYGSENPRPGAPLSIIGISVKNGVFDSNKPWEGNGSSILFTRPVVITVVSQYVRPNVPGQFDVGNIAPGLNPNFGTIYGTPIGTAKSFGAPEFIYLNRDFDELQEAGDVNASDSLKAWYRLVNVGYSLDGGTSEGTEQFFTKTVEHDLTVVWKWRLECAVFIDSPAGEQGGFGGPEPAVGRHWYELGKQLNASIDADIEDLAGGIRSHTTGYTIFDKNGTLPGATTILANDSATRRGITPISITDALRLKWNLIGQVRYRFDAFSSDKPGGSFDAHSFVRVYKTDARGLVDRIIYGNGANMIEWIDLGGKVDVGAFYRSSDGTLTLSGFLGTPGGDLSAVTSVSDHMEDEENFPAPPGGTARVARIYTVKDVTSPTDVHWNYQTTVFRAEFPLGQSLVVEPDGSVLNGQLAPPLPTGATLRVIDSGPGNAVTTRRGPADGSSIKTPDPLRWDRLGRALFPVHPGAYEVAWPGNDSKTYRVEILTGYPGETVTRTFASEDGNGIRILDGKVEKTGCTTAAGSTTVTCPDTTGLMPAMSIRGPNIANGTKIFAVPNMTTIVLDTAATASTSGTLELINCTTNSTTTVVCATTAGLAAGMGLSGSNIAPGTTIVSVTNATSFVISAAATGNGTGLSLTVAYSVPVKLTAWKNYLNSVTLAEIDPKAGFPAQPEHAHYHHLFDSDPAKQAPTKLDLSAADEWKFQDLTFADASTGASVNKTAAGVPFNVTGTGRSVLLYSYRPNSDEVADGTLADENLAVRVVRSSPVTVIPRTSSKLVLGRRGLQLGGGAAKDGGAFGIVGTGLPAIAPGNQFAVDFWLNAKTLQPSATVTLTNCTTNNASKIASCASTAGLKAGMSISGPSIPPGTKIESISSGTGFTLSANATASGAGLSLTASYSAATLTNCVTTLGLTSVTCASTADVVAGMSISGPNIAPGAKIAAKPSATTLVLTIPATATSNPAGVTLTAANKPVTVMTSDGGRLKVTLDAAASTVTATYRGIAVTHALSKAGAAWRHYVIHVFTQEVFGTGVTVVDFYLDGVRKEQALPTGFLQPGLADSAIGATLGSDSFRFGVDADPLSGLQLDQFRLFTFTDFPTDNKGYLSAGEVRRLKTERDMTATTIASVSNPTQFVLSKPATANGTGLTLISGAVTLTNCATISGSTTVTCASTVGLVAGTVVEGPNIIGGIRGYYPKLWFSFENEPPTNGFFANEVAPSTLGVGPVTGAAPFAGTWANVDVQEVATRIDSTLDNAGFGGSGFIRCEVSNYNAELYSRAAEVGGWGPIFPVNDRQLFTSAPSGGKRLEVLYYENPYLIDRVPHPNVAWPYVATEYNDVTFPNVGPHKDKAIYIASRIGSEGVDKIGRPQTVFDLARFSGLKIYNQPDLTRAGYNPNEEHALTAPSGRAALKVKNLGEALANNPPLAAFALQKDINNKPAGTYTSDPWVLVQVNNLDTGEPEMAAYQVFDVRTGTKTFPRPLDSEVGGSTGLAYEPAATPEARFLTLAPGATFNFEYKFDYPVFAGDLLIPPYPLNIVIGNVSMADERGGNIQITANGTPLNQRTLWRDAGMHAWVVSGGGKFFEQFFYPLRADFHLPVGDVGDPVAWLPAGTANPGDFLGDNQPGIAALDDAPRPVKVRYSSAWRSDYPKLKRGETLTYQGGEYFNENPGSQGLPAVVAMKAAEVVYDSATPTMVITAATTTELEKASARIIRPLDRREAPFTNAQMNAAGLIPGDPASSKVIVVAERWYFKELTGSLQKRFYFDSLAETLVFRGRLNDKEGGDPDLTAGPDPINVLEPDVLTVDDYKKETGTEKGLFDLATTGEWATAINTIFTKSQNPNNATAPATSTTNPVFLQGVKPVPPASSITAAQRALLNEQKTFWREDLSGTVTGPEPVLSQLDSFGVGSALVPNANLLTMNPSGSLYITLAENNRAELNGAPVSLHIIEIIPDRYRGAIKVIEGSDAFSERITLQHNGEFGANTGNLDYEWWIRDSRELDDTLKTEIESLATDLPNPNWQLYTAGLGLHTIVFQGRPDVVLADKLVLMRYRHQTETKGWKVVPFDLAAMVTLTNCTTNGTTTVVTATTTGLSVGMTVTGTNIAAATKVTAVNADGTSFVLSKPATGSGVGLSLTAAYLENTPLAAWTPGSSTVNAPFQWAGAANSPQFQADGSQRYIPQLVMGWVKRILDRINPYEARYTDFFSNESPASYTSMIQIAGGPYAGNVALNPDKNVIENTGLIELYRTVLARAEALSIKNSSNGNASDGINQALLLAATRLSVLYELLAREAYSDAQDPTIAVDETDPSGLANVVSFTHAFQNLEPSLLHEELALLRGSDFRKSYPVYNRMFWNYAKGLGEAAYNTNYNIYDVNTDGFINEDDARKLYPQGHGDAWGHFLSAVDMHYLLLQEPNFRWQARAELYSLMQNVLPVDYLDEKTFARLAAGKARAGRDIVRATYRLSYTNDPDGQWQGYTDGADKARAWGVSEWAHRAGQGAYFDWAVANALLPAQALDPATGKPLQNLSEIERSGAVDEIAGVAAGLYEIQTAMDESNNGSNPLGFSSDAIAFDIDPTLLYVGSTAQVGTRAIQGLTHFEQIFERAILAGNNAVKLLQVGTQANNKLRVIANDTESLIVDSLRQDLDYRNRLIEIFGRPYTGQIGFGKTYPEGYEGPDTMLYAYLDKITIDQIVPQVPAAGEQVPANLVTFNTVYKTVKGYGSTTDNKTVYDLFKSVFGSNGEKKLTKAFETIVGDNLYQEENTPLTLNYNTASKYGFEAPDDWGQRTSYGKIQTALGEMLAAEIALDSSIADYLGYLQDWEQKLHNLQSEVELFAAKEGIKDSITGVRAGFTTAITVAKAAIQIASTISKSVETGGNIAKLASSDVIVAGLAVTVPTAFIRAAVEAATGPAKIISDTTKEVLLAITEVAAVIRDEVIAKLERDIDKVDEVKEIEGLVADLEYHSGGDNPKRDAIGLAAQELELKRQQYISALSEGFRLLREREAFNKVLAAKSQKNRYQDMIMRLTRNEAMAKYQSAFNLAARYTWLSAKAYDYETSLDPGDPAAATQIFDQIVKERQLGLWTDGSGLGNPQAGKGGLAELLALMRGNFDALEGRIGLNNVQVINEGLSMRAENFRVGPPLDPAIQAALDTPVGNRSPEQVALIADNQDAIIAAAASDQRWKETLKACVVDDLNMVPEYRQHCRPITDPAAGKQPGVVIRFSSMIQAGQNFFGRPLSAGDHAYSTSQFSTRIAVAGVLLSGYQDSGPQGLASTPRAYLVPVGTDYCLVSTANYPKTRSWSVRDVRVPIPFVINQSQMSSPGFIPQIDGIDGTYGDVRRHADFRIFHDSDLDGDGNLAVEDENNSTRLMARSIWNSQWVLIIPGGGLYYDAAEGVKRFTDNVSDITLNFKTYSHNGQ